MDKLLSRDEFREGVFQRDNHECVICSAPAQDAHHIMERRLFLDGGYYLTNGASLCGPCHIKAEQTIISPAVIRANAGITRVVLPPHLYPDYEYDKWGNIVNNNGSRLRGELFYDESVQKILESSGMLSRFLPYVKYPRTFHLPFSFGRTDDDRALSDCSQFEGKEVVVTVKMDGENTTGYFDGYIHARSIDGRSHVSRDWVKAHLAPILSELPEGWRICGENLFAKHSIFYKNLKTYFNLFSVWDAKNRCLSWDETIEWAELLSLQTVPVLYRGIWDEDLIKSLYGPTYHDNECEGFVVRNAKAFPYQDFSRNLAKFVRANHVQTNKHWIKTSIIKNKL